MKWIYTVPIIGFNSSGYDINTIKIDMMNYYKLANPIKRSNRYLSLEIKQ